MSALAGLLVDGQIVAEVSETLERYSGAIADRRQHMIAANQFYHDLIVYQWRLDALDAELQSVRGTEDRSDLAAEVDRRRAAAAASLMAIDAQHKAAVAAFESRASDYAILAGATSGRLCADEEEKASALDRCRRLAKGIYEEITSEAQEILKVHPGEAGLRNLQGALERRRIFWNSQLEETWQAWQEATTAMHHAGEEVFETWAQYASAIAAAERHVELSSAPLSPSLSAALATSAARGFAMELLEPLGLTGLSATNSAREPEVRHAALSKILEMLDDTCELHRVCAEWFESALSALPPGVSKQVTEFVAAGGVRPTKATEFARPSDDAMTHALLAMWLARCIVIFVEESRTSASKRVAADICRQLGGDSLVAAAAELQEEVRPATSIPEAVRDFLSGMVDFPVLFASSSAPASIPHHAAAMP